MKNMTHVKPHVRHISIPCARNIVRTYMSQHGVKGSKAEDTEDAKVLSRISEEGGWDFHGYLDAFVQYRKKATPGQKSAATKRGQHQE